MTQDRNIKLRKASRYRIDKITADVTRKHVQDSDCIARQCSRLSNAEMTQKMGRRKKEEEEC